jgi:hypothetical protein
MNIKYFSIVAVMAAVLIGATALASTESVFAGGHGHKKQENNQATSSANACGNDKMPLNVGCQNANSQEQGDENAVSITTQQTFPDTEVEKEPLEE